MPAAWEIFVVVPWEGTAEWPVLIRVITAEVSPRWGSLLFLPRRANACSLCVWFPAVAGQQ